MLFRSPFIRGEGKTGAWLICGYDKTQRSKQDKANADFPTGVYFDVNDLGKTQVQRSIAKLICVFYFTEYSKSK